MKIGIITCFDKKNVNFGNRLQACALNRYMNLHYSDLGVTQTLYFQDFKDFKRTKNEAIIRRIHRKVNRDLFPKKNEKFPEALRNRLVRFNEFSERTTILVDHPLEREELRQLDYDVMIVGSDVVWYQWHYGIRPIKLLDFEMKKKFYKVAYAASMGNDIIPEENRKELKRCLRAFTAISVREKSTVKLLTEMGISNVCHAVDPTLLFDSSAWKILEKPIDAAIKYCSTGFVFTYLLGAEAVDRKEIMRISKTVQLPIVTVPYASGKLNDVDENFGDLQVIDCSPEEWLWLIHNASYVFTDSFHGAAFSVIYHTKFLVTRRKEIFEMNNRMKDFLRSIGQEDKFLNLSDVTSLQQIEWNFKEMEVQLQKSIDNSKRFLQGVVDQIKRN